MLSTVFSILAPHFCIVCNGEGSVLCAECSLTNLPALASLCAGCQKPSVNFKICTTCKPRIEAVRVWPATSYGDVAKHVVYSLKFAHARDAAYDMARLMADRLPTLPGNAVFVPVPTAASRSRQRGFDQAKLIAKLLAKRTGHIYVDAIRRHGNTRQVGASREQRAAQLTEVFWLKTRIPKNALVILVDDVFTTGATIGAAAKMLSSQGFSRVYATTFALAQ